MGCWPLFCRVPTMVPVQRRASTGCIDGVHRQNNGKLHLVVAPWSCHCMATSTLLGLSEQVVSVAQTHQPCSTRAHSLVEFRRRCNRDRSSAVSSKHSHPRRCERVWCMTPIPAASATAARQAPQQPASIPHALTSQHSRSTPILFPLACGPGHQELQESE